MVTGEMVEELIISGADIVKVGIGPGACMYCLKMCFTSQALMFHKND